MTTPNVSTPRLKAPAEVASLELNPHDLSATLYNNDLAPTTRKGRTWSSYSIFTLWANDVHSLGNYAFAIGLFALGLGGWQILLALGFGAILLFALLNFSGFMGEKTGVPFPVMSRIAFGIRGAQIPALIRGAVAVAWFGIQTYLASVVLVVMVLAVAPGAAAINSNNFLGLSTLGWICFVSLWAIQLVIVSYGMEMIRKYEAFAGPVILFTMGALALWMFIQAGGSIAWSTGEAKTGADMWLSILGGGALWVSIYATFVLNFCDFTRNAISKKSVVRGNFFGIPLNMLLFGVIVVMMTGAQFKIDGTIITSPSDVVESIPNVFLLLAASTALLVLTIAVNLMANFVAPIYALTNLFPKHLNFRRAGIISGTIGLLILPWNLYNSPAVITYFLGGLGAILGPLFGIIMADYWIMRRAKVNIPDLYRTSPTGTYFFTRGVNFRAVIALAVSAVAALVLAFSPAFAHLSSFAWFIGSGLGAVIYLAIAKHGQEYKDVSGEEIAVAPTH
ncbi:NCS1 family nucleobase:cation symporter-1 [Paeniglutamicibacter kerguelensis]|uniref:NCS1 family nucleobase:cation symporter-1 n=1 Tax=Paeniglutamicibacter kerguelensis TaxID=254788 RepID=A0ABS4XIE1_9MICC|nr:NCS1 family nucleobase:cation symporter-1 [Paeniglutamicibacter kerguelensis]MBP2388126.1 NCS1 family nucleobase:cation symporter-1 [Paeniglutamicibacter kerguelensis]